MNKYALFVAATPNYLSHLNALLNSIEKRELYKKCELTVYVLYHDNFNFEYLERIKRDFSYTVIPEEINKDDIAIDTKRIEFIKRARYNKMINLSLNYDAVCLLDCDMFFVSDQFMRLFDLVVGTELLIGCNERFKWGNGAYTMHDDPMFKRPGKMFQFICNTPAIFDMNKWKHVFEKYCEIAIYGTQEKGGQIVGIGDIMCWNLAINYCNKNDDIVMFPMETMAQVHHTNMRAWTYPINDHGYWHTFSGDRIYIIHGRINRPGFVEGCLNKYRELEKGKHDIVKVEPKIKAGLKAIQAEWNDLNFNQNIRLSQYTESHPL